MIHEINMVIALASGKAIKNLPEDLSIIYVNRAAPSQLELNSNWLGDGNKGKYSFLIVFRSGVKSFLRR